MKNQIIKQVLSLISGLALVVVFASPVGAQSASSTLLYQPDSKNAVLNQAFSIDIIVNSAGQDVAGIDAIFTFDSAYLGTPTINTNSGSDGGTVINLQSQGSAPGGKTKWGVSWLANPVIGGTPAYINSSTGEVATISFTPLQLGSTTLGFDYADSTVASPGGVDLLSISNGTATITISASGDSDNGSVFGPAILSISPTSGNKDIAQVISIFGHNFDSYVEGESKVYIGVKLATVLDWTDDRIEIQVLAEPELTQNSTRQIKVRRSDGEEAKYTGYIYSVTPLPSSGPEDVLWAGVILAALALTWLTYRKLIYSPIVSTSSDEVSDNGAPNIRYRF